ncbi:DUF1003 domain-containing protein [Parvibaculum sedimenti]|uniref:DUF1003 domain-containing protein n=1 Tax=Parvibaculum sedimenti TaxID=2608632 RepID=A0A6N6VHG8_9HYPH|nr:DUF1003 domain-containing protein [Parvibaculum sedimenti]KAB7739163.1 DUF1003 domain-containing protein [Parvibaculum sedimenti]
METTPKELLTGHDIALATARLRSEHEQETSGIQRAVDRLTAIVGRPSFVAILTLAILSWMVGNFLAGFLGFTEIDPSPFVWLQGALNTVGLYIAALILSTQRREDQLSSQREQLILELAILNDQKASKIIQLLEEGRRDNPSITDRVDEQALAMSTPSDPHSVLQGIKDFHEGST